MSSYACDVKMWRKKEKTPQSWEGLLRTAVTKYMKNICKHDKNVNILFLGLFTGLEELLAFS